MQDQPIHILLVEDERIHAELVRQALGARNYRFLITVADSLKAARALLAEKTFDLAIVDLFLPDGKGTELLAPPSKKPALPLLIMTSHGDEQVAVEAMKAGALDYLVKSAATLPELPHIIERSLREWHNLKERQRAETALRESEERFRSIFEHAASGMAVIAPDGKVLQINRTFCNLSGYSMEDCLQKNVLEVTHPGDREETRNLYQQIVNGERQFFEYEKRYLHRDGTIVWGHATVAGVRDESGKVLYCVAMVQDISERKRAEERLLDANRELDAFVSTVSHDLRIPLTPIIGYADYLKEAYGDKLDQQGVEILDSIKGQGHRMLGIMEDLLTLSRVGRVERPLEAVDAARVLRETLKDLGKAVQSSGCRIETGKLPALHVPESMLTQIFSNLLSNALRYAGSASSSIEVLCRQEGPRVCIGVRDHGPGIPGNDRERVFEQFYRGAGAAEIPGTGIGLAIVRKITQQFQGRAWAEETPGGGATFWVEFHEPSLAPQK